MTIIKLNPKHPGRLSRCYGQPDVNQTLIRRGMIKHYHDGQTKYTPGGMVMLAANAARDPESPHRDTLTALFDAADETGNMGGNDVYNLYNLIEAGTDPAGDGWEAELLCTLFRLIAANLEIAEYDIDEMV